MIDFIKQHEAEIKRGGAGLREIHERKLSYLQHERLVHLFIMLFFGLIDVIMVTAILSGVVQWGLLVVVAIITVMLVAYIWHYYQLENAVQRWYDFSEKLRERE